MKALVICLQKYQNYVKINLHFRQKDIFPLNYYINIHFQLDIRRQMFFLLSLLQNLINFPPFSEKKLKQISNIWKKKSNFQNGGK